MWSMFNSGSNAGSIVVRDQSDSANEGEFRERNAWALAGGERLFEQYFSKPNHGHHISYAVKLSDPFDDSQWPADMLVSDRLYAYVILPGKEAAIPPQSLLDPKRCNAEVWDKAYRGDDAAIATLTAKKCCCCKQYVPQTTAASAKKKRVLFPMLDCFLRLQRHLQ